MEGELGGMEVRETAVGCNAYTELFSFIKKRVSLILTSHVIDIRF